MYGILMRALAVMSFTTCLALPVSAQETVRIRGTVEQTVAGVDGPTLSVKYKDGEKKLVVGPDTVVVTYVMGSKDDLKPGTKIFVSAAKKQADGSLQTPRITYGRNGAGPAFDPKGHRFSSHRRHFPMWNCASGP